MQVTDQGYILSIDDINVKVEQNVDDVEEIISSWDRRGFIGRFSRRHRVFPNGQHCEMEQNGKSTNNADNEIIGSNGKPIVEVNGSKTQSFLFEDTTMAELTLSAGEGLYLPAGWAHEVESFGTHIAVTYWMRPDEGQLPVKKKGQSRTAKLSLEKDEKTRDILDIDVNKQFEENQKRDNSRGWTNDNAVQMPGRTLSRKEQIQQLARARKKMSK